jgi:hypothetical protein
VPDAHIAATGAHPAVEGDSGGPVKLIVAASVGLKMIK